MNGPGVSGEVVHIGARGSYRPSYKRLASGQVAAARRKLGITPAAYAAYLGDLLGWTVTPEAVEHWEQGSIPPGDVLLASAAAAQETPAHPGALLWSVPHSFPADALEGPWVTCYQFVHDGQQRHHADIAHVVAESDRYVRATNHPPEPRTEGRAFPFHNEIEAQLASRHLVGHWRNTSDTRYFGSIHLAVLPGETVMDGYYTGFASDIQVSMGQWKWVRLDLSGIVPATIGLRDPASVYELVMNYSQYDAPLTLADIGEET